MVVALDDSSYAARESEIVEQLGQGFDLRPHLLVSERRSRTDLFPFKGLADWVGAVVLGPQLTV